MHQVASQKWHLRLALRLPATLGRDADENQSQQNENKPQGSISATVEYGQPHLDHPQRTDRRWFHKEADSTGAPGGGVFSPSPTPRWDGDQTKSLFLPGLNA